MVNKKIMNMNKKYIILLFALTIKTLLFGQETIIDNGYEKGILKDGHEVGIWEYFDGKVLKLKVDYTTGELIYLAKDTSKYAIETEQGWEYSKLDKCSRYIGSMDEFLLILAQNLRYPSEAKTSSIIGTVYLYFEINLEGKASNVKIIRDIGSGCGNEVIRAFNLIPNYWITASKEGKPIKTRYILPVKFQIGERSDSEVIWREESEIKLNEMLSLKKNFEPVKYLDEVVISAVSIEKRKKKRKKKNAP